MIRAELEEKNGVTRLDIRGHAGYAPQGCDIVCAAVSAIAQSFINLCEEDKEVRVGERVVAPGQIHVIVTDPNGAVMSATKMLRIGLQGISEEYPDHVSVCVGCEEKNDTIE